MSRRASPTPLLDQLLELSRTAPMPLAALLDLPDEPTIPHRAETIVRNYRNFCGCLERAFPIDGELLANHLEALARAGASADDLRLCARVITQVAVLRRAPHPAPQDGQLDVALGAALDALLADYECKPVYDALGITFFDTAPTWGERAREILRTLAVLPKGTST